MRERNINEVLSQHRAEKEEQSRKKIKEFFMTGQINPEVAMYTLRLLGFTTMRTKQIVREWTDEKANAN